MEERKISKKLVAYFSASGTTKQVAEKVAKVADADIYEIVPETPYADVDLNWHNSKCRSSVEMNDHPEFRPAIIGTIENMEQYDTVLLGFPIWWYVAPTIINTFLESYDFSGKKIVLFATSGMSRMGKTIEALRPSAPQAIFGQEKRLKASISLADVDKWVKTLEL